MLWPGAEIMQSPPLPTISVGNTEVGPKLELDRFGSPGWKKDLYCHWLSKTVLQYSASLLPSYISLLYFQSPDLANNFI